MHNYHVVNNTVKRISFRICSDSDLLRVVNLENLENPVLSLVAIEYLQNLAFIEKSCRPKILFFMKNLTNT